MRLQCSMPKPAPPGGVRRALDQEELVLFYQPIHETQSRRIVAVEALLRARRGNGELRSAVSIAEGAEELPDLFRLDSWLVKTAYADAETWQRDGAPDVRLNVNLSPREFEEGNLAERLTGIAPKLSLEITETRTITLPEETRDTLELLKANGVEIWLDDFGTGHSCVEHLLFPIDGIKLPAQFVGNVTTDARCRAIVRSLIGLAHDLSLRVIGEGVETEEQLAFLTECGCDYIQGFLLSQPMAFEDFVAAVNAPNTGSLAT